MTPMNRSQLTRRAREALDEFYRIGCRCNPLHTLHPPCIRCFTDLLVVFAELGRDEAARLAARSGSVAEKAIRSLFTEGEP